MPEIALILPPELLPEAGEEMLHTTPYGPVTQRAGALLRAEGSDPRALLYAAKAAGARRVLAADRVAAVSPLLEEGDLVVPADTIDQTRLRPFTFFTGKGYGFIKLNPPFCPELMERLLAAGRAARPRCFRGATYVGTDGPREATPAELQMFRRWGAEVAGTGLLPEAYLARELELCYGAIAVVGEGDGGLAPLLRHLAEELTGGEQNRCACGHSMAHLKAQGVIPEDWRQW
ncbi:MAG: hypothetical protein ACOY93_12120 [Bacillota bacterium]